LLTAGVLVAVVVALLRGGSLAALAAYNFRRIELVFAGFGLQAFLMLAAGQGWPLPGVVAAGAHLLSYVLILVAAWQNRFTPGFKLIGLGMLANFVVIAANGGRMPVSEAALLQAGYVHLISGLQLGASFTHQLLVPGTRLWVLADIFVLPPPFPKPAVFSAGDGLILAGTFVAVNAIMRPPAMQAPPARKAAAPER